MLIYHRINFLQDCHAAFQNFNSTDFFSLVKIRNLFISKFWISHASTYTNIEHYNDVTMGAMASPLFIQLFIQAQIKENIKAPRHWPLCGEFTGDRWVPRTKGQIWDIWAWQIKCMYSRNPIPVFYESNVYFLSAWPCETTYDIFYMILKKCLMSDCKWPKIIIQWNLSVTTTSMIKSITCDLFSNVF